MKQKRPGRAVSLSWRLVTIVLLCWVLPVLLILGVMGAYSYSQVKQQIADTITVSAQNAANMVKTGIEKSFSDSRAASYDPTIRTAFAAYRNDGDKVTLYDTLIDYLTRQYRYNDVFTTTMLFFCSEPESIYYINNIANANAYGLVREYTATVHDTVQSLSDDIGTNIRFVAYNDTLYMVRNLVDSSFVPYAMLVMQIDKDVLFRELTGIVWLTDATVTLDGASVTVFGSGAKAPEGGRLVNAMRYEEDNGLVTVGLTQKLDQHSVSYFLRMDSSNLLNELSTMQKLLLPISIFVVPLLFIALFAFNRLVSRPVERLVEAASIIEKGELGYQATDIPSSSEFRYLYERFNSMSMSMKEQFERSYYEQLALQDSRMKALQSQINPHFLNNTLEIINWEARMAGNLNVSRMIESLSTLLSAATARGGNPMTHLSEELAFVDAYLYIISVRMGKRLTVVKEIDGELLPLLVPRLIMQPVVENAVEHGITPRQRGTLTLRVYAEGGTLRLEVENDGGMNEADKEAIARLLNHEETPEEDVSKPGQVGIRNVNQRLKLLYGSGAGLSIEETDAGNTLARISLPNK
ncbi:MAG TPA: sensor histidine kinase [Feifaniaceae bacterium]|nr:sensor histidine kinase [Feifaniaceae bacterium]